MLPIANPRPLMQLAEFESDAVAVSDRRYVMRLLSYPTVCVKRAFLDDAVAALREGRAPVDGLSSSSAGSDEDEDEGPDDDSSVASEGADRDQGCGLWGGAEGWQGPSPGGPPASPSLSAA